MANFKRRKEELYKCIGCRGCTNKCLSNGKIAKKEVALRNSEFMSCNNATELSIIGETLTPSKSGR